MERPWFAHYEAGVPRTVSYPEQTLSQLLDASVRAYPQSIATNFVLSYLLGGRVTIGARRTYQQLGEDVNRFANALYQIGVRRGDRVALMLPNSPHFVIAFFAAMRIGAVIVNNNPTYTSRELKHQLVDSGAETIVMLNLFWPRLHEVQAETPVRRVVIVHVFDTLAAVPKLLVRAKQRRSTETPWVDVEAGNGRYMFEDLLRRYGPTPPPVDVTPDDDALFQYTGGTTGLPKAAVLTHRNIIANTHQLAAWFQQAEPGRERVMCAIPFFHVYGMTVAMVFGLSLGAELTILPNPREIELVLSVIQKERVTLFPGVPAQYIRIINHPEVGKYNLRSIKACLSGSAPLPVEVQQRFHDLTGGRLVEGYGMTELSPVSHANPIFGAARPGSIGLPLPDVDARIIDLDSGADIPFGSDQEGELLVRGPMVMKGYWNKPEETAVTLTADGWLHTGDICKVDADGYFRVVDRKKDMIIVSGYKVLPRDVEEVLFTHPDILEACVAGIPDRSRGDETVKAYVVRKPGTNPSAEQIQEFCRNSLAPYKVPRVIEFRDELPKTTVGKVLRRALVEQDLARATAGG
ncbi:MAG: long-chain fatty acid--CoA ligase [Chloroflexi bacterium]|nr:long-chain fatty acid--CoA ligase [Chloroflexota bacterium]